MPEFFLEFCSEEIPAGMQQDAATRLGAIYAAEFDNINFSPKHFYSGPRRIALSGTVDASTGPEKIAEVRGPREGAPEAAINGFVRKNDADWSDLVSENGHYILRKKIASQTAADVLLAGFAAATAKYSWPKSMRWGGSADFFWVRPLRSLVFLIDQTVVPVTLGPITADRRTTGHRIHAPDAFEVTSGDDWRRKLKTHYVVADREERRGLIAGQLGEAAAARGLIVATDDTLLDEVTGLVEWPVALLGKIDAHFMTLPPEVRELSMKVNQRYFALRDAAAKPAPYFAFVANLETPDGAAIIAGNERVLRARLADARHFWDLDLRTSLDGLLPKLETIVFHAKLGTQRQRADRISKLAGMLAEVLHENMAQAEWAGLLCKADLVTGMVGEFPELQGIMGGYYAEQNTRGWDGGVVGPAIATHYQPKGPNDTVPPRGVAACVALADKVDTLVNFFRIGERPTGSGDPYALRRSALGIIRIILENQLRLKLRPHLGGDPAVFDFIIDRLRVKLRGEGRRFDILDAVLAAGADDDLVRIMKRVTALSTMLQTEDGANLLAAYKRAANILRMEDAKDGPHTGEVDVELLQEDAEKRFYTELTFRRHAFDDDLISERYDALMTGSAGLRNTIDIFFNDVTVNAEPPDLRRNRLALLARFRDTVNQIADFSKIES